MKIRDISMNLFKGMPTYPGNPIFIRKSIKMKNSIISEIKLGTHTGTHIDAPGHVISNAEGVDKIKLDKFYGKCKVLNLTNIKFGEGIKAKHLKKFKINKNDIILLKTKNSPLNKFRKDYIYLTEDGAEYLVKKKIKTVGIDALGIQKVHQGYCTAHCVLLKKNIIIFEGLNLNKIKPGNYTFIGFPIKIKDSDGAPARAVLIK